MTLTSSFLVLIMFMIWKTNILLVISFVLVLGYAELLYLSSVLYKFDQEGYLPLAFAGLLMTVMLIWSDMYRRKYDYELRHKISSKEVVKITSVDANLCRIPGLAMFCSELVHGIPPIFKHCVPNVPALHNVLVFVSIKSLPISKVPQEERFLLRRVEPRDCCVAGYGYNDICHEHEPFEKLLVEKLKDFMTGDFWRLHVHNMDQSGVKLDFVENNEEPIEEFNANRDNETSNEGGRDQIELDEILEREIEALDRAWHDGVVHLIGENEVVACKEAGIGNRILIDYAYNFLKKNLRQCEESV